MKAGRALAIAWGIAAALAIGATAEATGGAVAASPLSRVLGIGLGMSEERVHQTLGRIGHRADLEGEGSPENEGEGEELERELWVLRDRRYTSVLVVFDEAHQLRAVQAYLKPGARALRYSEIGDLGQARRLGYTIWQWDVASQPGKPGRRVIARGVDSTYVGSVAITALP